MKKVLISLFLIVALCVGCAMAESTAVVTAEDYPGTWVSGEHCLTIEAQEDGTFTCTVTQNLEANQTALWTYEGCTWDEVTLGLGCEQVGVKTVITDNEGDLTEETVFENGAATFTIDQDGMLIWTDYTVYPDQESVAFTALSVFAAETIAHDYEGLWKSENGETLMIESLDDVVYATVKFADEETAERSFENLVYDWSLDSLVCFEGDTASFKVDDMGTLTFVDEADGLTVDFTRTVAPAEAPSPEAFADEYFRVIGAVEKGTAGASLKLCQAAADVVTFADKYALYNPDVEPMRANMLAGYESLTDDERAAFDGNFADVVNLLNACIEDWDSQAGAFEDAGVADIVSAVVFDPLTKLAWENLSGHTFTLGNVIGY